MKIAERRTPNRWATRSSNRAHGAGPQNRSGSSTWAEKQEKFQPVQGCLFLTSPFIELTRSWPSGCKTSRACLAIESEDLGILKNDSSRLVLVQKADAAWLVGVWGLLIVPGRHLYIYGKIVYPLSRLGLPLRRTEGVLVVGRSVWSRWYFFCWGRCVQRTSRFSHWCLVHWGLRIRRIFADPLGESQTAIARQGASRPAICIQSRLTRKPEMLVPVPTSPVIRLIRSLTCFVVESRAETARLHYGQLSTTSLSG
jgi:hypothetical protein